MVADLLIMVETLLVQISARLISIVGAAKHNGTHIQVNCKNTCCHFAAFIMLFMSCVFLFWCYGCLSYVLLPLSFCCAATAVPLLHNYCCAITALLLLHSYNSAVLVLLLFYHSALFTILMWCWCSAML